MRQVLVGLLCLLFLVGCSQSSSNTKPNKLDGLESFTSVYNTFDNAVVNEIQTSLPKDRVAFTGSIEPVIKIHTVIDEYEGYRRFSSGSGFFIERRGVVYIMTAHHVIDEGKSYQFLSQDNDYISIEAGRMYLIPSLDCALIEVKKCSAKYQPYKVGQYNIHDQVTAIGYPHNKEKVISKGQILRSQLEASVNVDSGMSGGPLVNERNEVVGVNSLKVLGDDKIKGVFSNAKDVFYVLERSFQP